MAPAVHGGHRTPRHALRTMSSRLFHRLSIALRSFVRRRTVDQELDDELRFHLEQFEEFAASRGEDPSVARDAARQHMGRIDYVKEVGRDMRPLVMVLREASLLAVVGVIVGAGIGTGLGGFVEAVLYGVTLPDSIAIGVACLTGIPTSAQRVSPMVNDRSASGASDGWHTRRVKSTGFSTHPRMAGVAPGFRREHVSSTC